VAAPEVTPLVAGSTDGETAAGADVDCAGVAADGAEEVQADSPFEVNSAGEVSGLFGAVIAATVVACVELVTCTAYPIMTPGECRCRREGAVVTLVTRHPVMFSALLTATQNAVASYVPNVDVL
jgi:hypothetical protein